MGEHSEEFAANAGGENWASSYQTHHVGVSPQEDRGGTKGTVGEDKGCEQDGGVAS
jgi:hypothetical protein